MSSSRRRVISTRINHARKTLYKPSYGDISKHLDISASHVIKFHNKAGTHEKRATRRLMRFARI